MTSFNDDSNIIDPSKLSPSAIGQGIRVMWEDGLNGHVALVQGVLQRITHERSGTELVVDIGVDTIVLTPRDLNAARVTQV